MKRRRIIVILILAFILSPLVTGFRMFFDVVVLGNEMPNHLSMSYWEYQDLHKEFLLIMPLGYLFTILIPYNLIILNYPILLFRKLWVKILVMTGNHLLIVCIIGAFANIWAYPLWQNTIYIGIALIYSSIMVPIIHFAVDRREIREMKELSS